MHTAPRPALILLAALALAATLSPPRLRAWQYQGDELQPIPLPANPQPLLPQGEITLSQGDLNQDGQPDRIENLDNQLFIYTQSDTVAPSWQSPPEWQVQQALVTDLDHDALPELALLVWRPFTPWPIDSYLPHGGRIADHQDRRGQSCHLVLIGWLGDDFGERWAGSALARPLREIAAADLDGDGWQELIALESEYNDPAFLPARGLAVWRWNGFGFDLHTRTRGRFHHLEVVHTPAGTILLSN